MTNTTTTTNDNAMIWELPEGYFTLDNKLFKKISTEVAVTDAAGNETVQKLIEGVFVHWFPIRVKGVTKLPSGAVFEVESAEFGYETDTVYYDIKQLAHSEGHKEALREFFIDSIAWLQQKELELSMT